MSVKTPHQRTLGRVAPPVYCDEQLLAKLDGGRYFVRHSAGMQLNGQFLAEDGQPINLTDLQTVLLSLARTLEGRKRLERRLRKLGYKLEWHRDVHA